METFLNELAQSSDVWLTDDACQQDFDLFSDLVNSVFATYPKPLRSALMENETVINQLWQKIQSNLKSKSKSGSISASPNKTSNSNNRTSANLDEEAKLCDDLFSSNSIKNSWFSNADINQYLNNDEKTDFSANNNSEMNSTSCLNSKNNNKYRALTSAGCTDFFNSSLRKTYLSPFMAEYGVLTAASLQASLQASDGIKVLQQRAQNLKSFANIAATSDKLDELDELDEYDDTAAEEWLSLLRFRNYREQNYYIINDDVRKQRNQSYYRLLAASLMKQLRRKNSHKTHETHQTHETRGMQGKEKIFLTNLVFNRVMTACENMIEWEGSLTCAKNIIVFLRCLLSFVSDFVESCDDAAAAAAAGGMDVETNSLESGMKAFEAAYCVDVLGDVVVRVFEKLGQRLERSRQEGKSGLDNEKGESARQVLKETEVLLFLWSVFEFYYKYKIVKIDADDWHKSKFYGLIRFIEQFWSVSSLKSALEMCNKLERQETDGISFEKFCNVVCENNWHLSGNIKQYMERNVDREVTEQNETNDANKDVAVETGHNGVGNNLDHLDDAALFAIDTGNKATDSDDDLDL